MKLHSLFSARCATMVAFSSALLLTVMTSCTKSNTPTVEREVAACEITAPLDSLVEDLFPENDGPGGVLAVMRGDSIVYEYCRGMADIDSLIPINGNTSFNLSSASKLFTSIAMLKLIDEGQLSLDDTLDKFFPEFPQDIFGKITLRHLMTHTSGLPDLRPCTPDEWGKFIADHNSVFGDIDTYRLYARSEEHIKVFKHLERSLYEPGTQYMRHDPSYMLITPLIERLTGQRFEDWMQTNIFDPAGIKSIRYFQPGQTYTGFSHAYRRCEGDGRRSAWHSADGRWEEADYGETDFFLTRADRGAFASPRAFLTFLRALYDGKIVPDSIVERTADIYYDSTMPYIHFGLGNAIRTEPGMPLKRYHMYNNGGFQVIEATWPEYEISYVLFANRNDWDYRDAAAKIDKIIKSKGWLD